MVIKFGDSLNYDDPPWPLYRWLYACCIDYVELCADTWIYLCELQLCENFQTCFQFTIEFDYIFYNLNGKLKSSFFWNFASCERPFILKNVLQTILLFLIWIHVISTPTIITTHTKLYYYYVSELVEISTRKSLLADFLLLSMSALGI